MQNSRLKSRIEDERFRVEERHTDRDTEPYHLLSLTIASMYLVDFNPAV